MLFQIFSVSSSMHGYLCMKTYAWILLLHQHGKVYSPIFSLVLETCFLRCFTPCKDNVPQSTDFWYLLSQETGILYRIEEISSPATSRPLFWFLFLLDMRGLRCRFGTFTKIYVHLCHPFRFFRFVSKVSNGL